MPKDELNNPIQGQEGGDPAGQNNQPAGEPNDDAGSQPDQEDPGANDGDAEDQSDGDGSDDGAKDAGEGSDNNEPGTSDDGNESNDGNDDDGSKGNDPPPVAPAKENRKQLYQAIRAEAVAAVEAEMGEQFNELDPDHTVALQVESQRIITRHQNYTRASQTIVSLIETNGGKEFAKFIASEKDAAPHGVISAMDKAATRGDMTKSIEFVKACAEKFKKRAAANKKAAEINARGDRPQNQQRQPVEPPPAIGAGGGGSPARSGKNETPMRELLGR